MSTRGVRQGSAGPSFPAKVAIGVAAFVVSVVIVLAGVFVFAGELAPGGQRGSMLVMALWFLAVVVVGFLIQRRINFLRWPLAVGVVGTIVAVTGVLAFSQITDRVVNEDVAVVGEPAAQTSARDGATARDSGAPSDEPAQPGGPVNTEISSGSFEGLAHTTNGTATAIELAEGGRVLTLTDFETDNGPDLRVYLVSGEVDSNGDGDDFVDIGGLRGNIGNQQYDIPESVDLSRFDSVVIWCRAFSAGFGVAELAPAGGTTPT